ncbi:putative amidase [Phytophthora infestans]|uniref:Putative amidase n=1 Tax=Phytophthora infestans TaxID=4787 RepID=A0A833W3R2_PHYIN|nr:putative amidase [Phytophthora infestans]KAF4130048.1 putative Amidase [Phytophthora infestans]
MDINPDDFKAPFSAYEFGTHVVENKSDLVLFACAWNDFEDHDIEPFSTLSYWAQRLSLVIDALGKVRTARFSLHASCVLFLKEPSVVAHAGRRTEELLRAEIDEEFAADM